MGFSFQKLHSCLFGLGKLFFKIRYEMCGLEVTPPFLSPHQHTHIHREVTLSSWFDQPRIQSLMRCEGDTQGRKRRTISGWLPVTPYFLVGAHGCWQHSPNTQVPINSCCCTNLRPEFMSPFQNAAQVTMSSHLRNSHRRS